MDKNKMYYNLTVNNREATIDIYGDITSWPWLESDVSAYNLSQEINELDVDVIDVHINSYGGEVAEGLAIYNRLRQNKAMVRTYCDGFACSIASIIFMAGDQRIMMDSSLLMIHYPWTWVSGNAEDMRKEAEDLDKIGNASITAYMNRVNINEDELREMMENETWISPQEALDMGFATVIAGEQEGDGYSQNARKAIMQMVLKGNRKQPEENGMKSAGEEKTPAAEQYPKEWGVELEQYIQKCVSEMLIERQRANKSEETTTNKDYKEKFKRILEQMEV